jgi:hypothetical protein
VVIGRGPARDVLTDGDLLRRAHLRLPLALDVGLAVKELGLVSNDVLLPRSRAELLEMLTGLKRSAPSTEASGGCGEAKLRAVSE